MKKGKLTVIIFGSVGCIIALLICGLGLSMFLQETDTHTSTYGFLGLTIKGKTLATILIWFGLVLLFYGIRKMIKYLKSVE
jgi:hypothetical protein